jgi:hypothetical protein
MSFMNHKICELQHTTIQRRSFLNFIDCLGNDGLFKPERVCVHFNGVQWMNAFGLQSFPHFKADNKTKSESLL